MKRFLVEIRIFRNKFYVLNKTEMKFTAKASDLGHIENFIRIVHTISKLTKVVAIRITPSQMCFVKEDSLKENACRIYCQIDAKKLFDDFRMEGFSVEQNEIFAEINSDELNRALKSASNAKILKIKLTKKNVPYLTMEVKLPSISAAYRTVVHDIPVKIVPPRLWTEYAEPEIPQFDASVYAPHVKTVQKVVGSMKNMDAKHLIVSVNNNCEMNLRIESDVVTVTTHFNDLVQPDWNCDENRTLAASQTRRHNRNDPINKRFYSVRVDIKTFLQFLTCQQIVFCKLLTNVLNEKFLHFYVASEEFTLQYFIPAVLH